MYRSRSAIISLASALVLAGCAADDDDPDAVADDTGTSSDPETGGEQTDEGTTTSGSSGGSDLAELYACEETELQEFQPLSGPGFDPETGALVEPLADEYVVSTTQILADPETMGTFLEVNDGVVAQLQETDGFLGLSLALEPNCGFARTLAVWRSEEAMYTFVATGAHAEAMGQFAEIAVTGRVTSFTLPAEQMPPTWELAIDRIGEIDPLGGY